MEFLQHLRNRCKCDPRKYGAIDEEQELFTRLLYNLSGQIVGYQRYNWKANKAPKNKPSGGRYYTYLSEGKTGIAGLEYADTAKQVYLVEGMFEQITAAEYGLNCLAVLCNSPKHLKNFIACWAHPVIALCQNDDAGMKLRSVADSYIVLPADLDEMSRADVELLSSATQRI